MLKTEAQHIAKLTAKPIEEFAAETEEHEPYAYEMRKTSEEGNCIFLKNKACTIYEHRPVICRFYPFEFRPTKSHVNEFLATDECPGIDKGPRPLRKSYFADLLRQLEEVSKSDSVFE
jgi:Fe-S-cluster containining protein